MNRTNKRIKLLFIALVSCSLGIAIILYQLNDNITLYYTPSKLNKNLDKYNGSIIRIGGFIKDKSIKKTVSKQLSFIITDYESEIKVNYRGKITMIFREGQGVIVKGKYDIYKNILYASELLTKHDEKYFPK